MIYCAVSDAVSLGWVYSHIKILAFAFCWAVPWASGSLSHVSPAKRLLAAHTLGMEALA